MISPAYTYLITFVVSFMTAFLLVPPLIRFAYKHGVVDKPGPRRVNKQIKARFGGPSMAIAVWVALGVIFALSKLHLMGSISGNWAGIVAGSFLMFLIGLIDDLKGARALIKLGLQVAAATAAYAFGVRILYFSNPFTGSIIYIPLWLSFFMTVFWIIAMTNAVNLIDGLDGLAAGIICIASITFFLASIQRGQVSSAIVALALVGATGGFLRWNYYPSKIIMGDSGAYFLGYMAAVVAITGAFKSTTAVTLLIPVFALSIPIFDTSFAIIRRAHSGGPIMTAPDKGHLHHRMLAAGLQHRDAVIICHLITLGLSAIALAIMKAWILALSLFGAVCMLAMLLLVTGRFKRIKKRAFRGIVTTMPENPPQEVETKRD